METVRKSSIQAFLEIGDGYGSGSSSRSGSGSGYGSRSGTGYGDGDRSGYGDGVSFFDGKPVYQVDGIQTLIYSIVAGFAKGAILNNDLTLTPCFIAKGGNCFAHGETIKKAVAALQKNCLRTCRKRKESLLLSQSIRTSRRNTRRGIFGSGTTG